MNENSERRSSSSMLKKFMTAAIAATVAAGAFSSCTDLTLSDFMIDPSSAESSDTQTNAQNDSSSSQEENDIPQDGASAEDSAAQTDQPEADSTSDVQQSPPDQENSDTDTQTLPQQAVPSDTESEASSETDSSLTESRPGALTENIGLHGNAGAAMDSYAQLIDEAGKKCADDPLYNEEFCRYYLADIGSDGVTELIIETGTCEADRMAVVYTFDGTAAKELGSFITWHAELGYENGVLYSETSAMGSFTLNTVTIVNDQLEFTKGESSFESQIRQKLAYYPLTDASGVNSNSGVQAGI